MSVKIYHQLYKDMSLIYILAAKLNEAFTPTLLDADVFVLVVDVFVEGVDMMNDMC